MNDWISFIEMDVIVDRPGGTELDPSSVAVWYVLWIYGYSQVEVGSRV